MIDDLDRANQMIKFLQERNEVNVGRSLHLRFSRPVSPALKDDLARWVKIKPTVKGLQAEVEADHHRGPQNGSVPAAEQDEKAKQQETQAVQAMVSIHVRTGETQCNRGREPAAVKHNETAAVKQPR